MAKAGVRQPRREDSLSRQRIVSTAIEILDSSGEGALTFRTLSERLATGPGAIYGHIANKDDLLAAACDAVILQTLADCPDGETPASTIRAVAMGLFDAMDAHPWVGSALVRAQVNSPLVHILERLGQQVRALGTPAEAEWATVAALMNYILGVGGQNAANGQHARTRGLGREAFLTSVAEAWLELDPEKYPFTRSVARLLPDHDDRADFLAGIDLILHGIPHGNQALPEQARAPTKKRKQGH